MNTLELKQAELELLAEDIQLFKKEIEKLIEIENYQDSNVQIKINELKEKIKINEQQIEKWSPILEKILKLQNEIKKLNSKKLELSHQEIAIKNELEKYSLILNSEE